MSSYLQATHNMPHQHTSQAVRLPANQQQFTDAEEKWGVTYIGKNVQLLTPKLGMICAAQDAEEMEMEEKMLAIGGVTA